MPLIDLETMRDLSEQVSDRSVPRPVYQHDQQSSDAFHVVSNENTSSSNEVRSRQFSHDRYFSRNTAAGELLGIGSQHPPPDNVHFDPGFNHFNMGNRSSFAWPGMYKPGTAWPLPPQNEPSNLTADVVLEPTNGGLLGQDMGHYAPDSSLSPPMHSRSATSSPLRMSTEQRELKRQRDQARRDSKLPARIQRVTQGELTHTSSISSMPTYTTTTTTTPTDISLLTEPTTSASPMVLPCYSPPLPANVIGFPSPYQKPQYMDYTYPPSAVAPLSSHYGPVSHDPAMMYSIPPLMQTGRAPHQHDHSHDPQGHVRVVQSRPRPQCWEHGCNGRQFSTFSNLLRHQREKSGQAVKASYPNCGAEFRRTTVRHGYLAYRKRRQEHTGSTSVIENGGQLLKVLNEHQEPYNIPSMPHFLGTPSRPAGPPRTRNVVSTVRIQGCGEAMDAVSSPRIVKEAQLPSSSEAISSPNISPHPTLTATDEPLVEEPRSVRAALVPDDTHGLAPEDTPCAMSEMSDEESFETSSGSEGPGSPNSLAESRRHILIDRTISWMISWVDSRLGVLAFQAHGTHGEGHQESPRPQTKTCTTTTRLTRDNRKRCQKDGRGPGDEDSDGEDCVPPPSQGFGAADNDETLEFACPFLKHNSKKYQNIRSCSASGWKSIHRIKEHLYRCHLLPLFQCIRCRTNFKSSEQLLQHSQAEIACNVVRDDPDQDGISQEQVMKLKSRKRNRGVSSDHDKWIHIYKILFPGDYLIPSPYFQRGNSGEGQESLLTALRQHVGRELPRLIRPRLEESVDATIRDALGPDMLESLVRDILGQVLGTFPWHTPEATSTELNEKQKDVAYSAAGSFPGFAQRGSDDLTLHNVPTIGAEQNASEPWVFSNQEGMEQPESSQQASQRIDREAMKGHMGCGGLTGMELGPSDFPSMDGFPYLLPTTTENTGGGSALTDFFNFEDFQDECAAWLGQSEESSSHADSGYSSLQFVDKMEDPVEKGKGKEVVRERRG